MNNNDIPENETEEHISNEEQNVFTFQTSPISGISFSIASPQTIRNRTRLPQRSQIINPHHIMNRIYYDPIFRYLPTYNTLVGGGAPAPGNILNASLYDKEAYKQVLSEKGKEEIVYRKYDKKNDEIKKCPIMFTDFEDDEEIAQLPCGHIFDKDGISKWLEEEDASCPVCRKKLDSKEIKNEDEEIEQTPPPLPSANELIRTFRQRSMAIIDDAEERMMQMAIEESLR